jgi:hypothetical protein
MVIEIPRGSMGQDGECGVASFIPIVSGLRTAGWDSRFPTSAARNKYAAKMGHPGFVADLKGWVEVRGFSSAIQALLEDAERKVKTAARKSAKTFIT